MTPPRPSRYLADLVRRLRALPHETNSSLRARFKIADRNASTVSRILADAVDEEMIVVADPAAGPRLRRYLPFWARA